MKKYQIVVTGHLLKSNIVAKAGDVVNENQLIDVNYSLKGFVKEVKNKEVKNKEVVVNTSTVNKQSVVNNGLNTDIKFKAKK